MSVKLILAAFLAYTAHAVDMKDVEKQLTSTGVQGWVHAAVPEQGLYVFTYRTPGNFFDYVEMSLIPSTSTVAGQLSSFDRHDLVKVKGSFLKTPNTQPHILISSIDLITKYKTNSPTEHYHYETKVPDDLIGKTSGIFFVHAVAGDGHILVTEYQDVVIPMSVKNGDLTKNLFRNDLVRLNFKIQKRPNEPVHLDLDESTQQPVQVLDSIVAKHGKPASVEGPLIMFPQSPEINMNVFAVQEDLAGGAKRQYTIVNMDNPDLFKQVHDALQKEWNKFPGEYTNGRNKLVSKRIRVKVTGTYNEVDPNQANPQVFVGSVDAIKFTEN